jgi:hypothetical protein
MMRVVSRLVTRVYKVWLSVISLGSIPSNIAQGFVLEIVPVRA